MIVKPKAYNRFLDDLDRIPDGAFAVVDGARFYKPGDFIQTWCWHWLVLILNKIKGESDPPKLELMEEGFDKNSYRLNVGVEDEEPWWDEKHLKV